MGGPCPHHRACVRVRRAGRTTAADAVAHSEPRRGHEIHRRHAAQVGIRDKHNLPDVLCLPQYLVQQCTTDALTLKGGRDEHVLDTGLRQA